MRHRRYTCGWLRISEASRRLAVPVRNERGRAYNEGRRAAAAALSCTVDGDGRQGLQRLPEPHLVAQHAVHTKCCMAHKPGDATPLHTQDGAEHGKTLSHVAERFDAGEERQVHSYAWRA